MLTWLFVACDAGRPAPLPPPHTTTPSVPSPPSPTWTSATTGTTTTPSGPWSCAAPADPLAGADLDLSPLAGGCTADVVADLGGDGADDVVARLDSRTKLGPYEWEVTSTLHVLPDVLGGADELVLGSPATATETSTSNTVSTGLIDAVSTPDATGDGVPDLWVEDHSHEWSLIPGPVTSSLSGPPLLAVATLSWHEDLHATDLDADGVAELVTHGANAVMRCSGPFAGRSEVVDCPTATLSDWWRAQPIATDDVDGDGVDDILVGVDGLDTGPGWLGVGGLSVLDGAFPDGTHRGRFRVTPEWTAYFDDDMAALADFDGDGYADLAWADEPNWSPAPGLGELAVVHGPIADDADLHLADATLHLVGGGDGATIGAVADLDGDGLPNLVLHSPEVTGSFLFDASVRGTVDPADAPVVISAVGRVAGVGDFDGDDRDDLLFQDLWDHQGLWVFLGASIP